MFTRSRQTLVHTSSTQPKSVCIGSQWWCCAPSSRLLYPAMIVLYPCGMSIKDELVFQLGQEQEMRGFSGETNERFPSRRIETPPLGLALLEQHSASVLLKLMAMVEQWEAN